MALDWSVRKAAAPLSLSVLSLIASVSPVRKAPHRLSRRKRGAEAADTSSPFAAIALTSRSAVGGVKEADTGSIDTSRQGTREDATGAQLRRAWRLSISPAPE